MTNKLSQMGLFAIASVAIFTACQPRQIASNEGFFPAGYLRTSVRLAYNYKHNELAISVACVPVKDVYRVQCTVTEASGFTKITKPVIPQQLRSNQQQTFFYKRNPAVSCYLKFTVKNVITQKHAVYEVTWVRGEKYPQVSARNIQGNIIYMGNIFKNPENDF